MKLITSIMAAGMLLFSVPSQADFMFGNTSLGGQTLSVTTTTGTVNIAAFDTGFYRADGVHVTSNDNYIVCVSGSANCGGANPGSHDFFAFRLGTITGTIQSATLTVFGGNYSGPASMNLTLWDVSGDQAALLGGTGGVAAYNDLG